MYQELDITGVMEDGETTAPRSFGIVAEGGLLAIVPTPIGNLGDITLRALDALERADAIYAEDTRVTGKLMHALEVSTEGRLHRLDENTLAERAAEVVERVKSGQLVAYCTDAGMPGVSDPGLRLVRAVLDAEGEVEVLPGASAAITAYVASGTTFTNFYFGGFFPRKTNDQTALLSELAQLDAALVFYESPKRVAAAMKTIAGVFPYRNVAICRELTKLHEEVIRGNCVDVAHGLELTAATAPVKGEIVIVIDGPNTEEAQAHSMSSREAATQVAARLAEEGASQKTIVAELVGKYHIPRNDAYHMALKAKEADLGL